MMTSPEKNDDRQKPNHVNPWNPVAATFRCWRWALPVGFLLAAVTAATIVFSFVPKYRASCLIAANQDWVHGTEQIQKLAKSDIELLLNPIVLDPVLNVPGIRSAPSLAESDDAEKNLRSNLTVTIEPSDNRMAVSYEDTDPESATLVCNAIVDSYLRQRNATDNGRVSNLEALLEPEIQRWELEVSEKKRTIETLAKFTLPFRPEGFGFLTDQKIAGDFKSLRSKVGEIKREVALIDAKIALGESKFASGAKSADYDSRLDGERSQSDKETKRKRESLLAELKVLENRFLDEKSKLDKVGSQIVELQFAQDELKIASEVLSRLRFRLAEIRTERKQDGAVRVLTPATVPLTPTQPFPIRTAIWTSALVFLAPFLLGYLLGFKPARDSDDLKMESVDERG